MRLDLGAGIRREAGYVSVDVAASLEPDVVWDLERFPWPWDDASATEVRMLHVLEHLGQDPKVFLRIMGEVNRVLAPGGLFRVHVPHPRSDTYLGNYQHVRPVTQLMLQQFSRKHGFSPEIYSETGIDLEIVEVTNEPFPEWSRAVVEGRLTVVDLERAMHEQFNVVNEIRILMKKVVV